jgi:hypothetical protein
MTRPAPLLSTTSLTVLAGTVVLRALGWVGHRLDRPERASLTALGAWFQSVEPVAAGATVIWSAAVLLTIWLLAAAALQIMAAIAGGRGLRTVADTISPRSLQRFGNGLAALSLSAGLAAAPSAGIPDHLSQDPAAPTAEADLDAPRDAPSGTATMTRLDPPPAEPPPPSTAPSSTVPTTIAPTTTVAPEATSTSALVPPSTTVPSPTASAVETASAQEAPPAQDGGAFSTTGPGPQHASDRPPLAQPAQPVELRPHPERTPRPASAPEADVEEVIVVQPGMSFWSIAEEVMAADGTSGDERALARYWRSLIDLNRDRLVAPGNADLLLPGQELLLPER